MTTRKKRQDVPAGAALGMMQGAGLTLVSGDPRVDGEVVVCRRADGVEVRVTPQPGGSFVVDELLPEREPPVSLDLQLDVAADVGDRDWTDAWRRLADRWSCSAAEAQRRAARAMMIKEGLI